MMCTEKNHLFALPVLVLFIFISLLFNCFSPRHGEQENWRDEKITTEISLVFWVYRCPDSLSL